MSKDTSAAVDEAIRAHIADELDGRLCSGWALIGVAVNGEQVGHGGASYHYETMPGQPYHASLGLAHLLLQWLEPQETEDDE